ncbi:MAG: tyrosine-type recombinase/integrase [Leptospiraceae bacterium]|nr:tyrosine-type recombinase/integrase [Leptospiraceae bacterium]
MDIYNKGNIKKNGNVLRDKRNYFTTDEILKLLEIIKSNYLHYLWIKLLYSFALTPTELVNIKVSDINFRNLSIKIHSTGRHRARILKLPIALIRDLKSETTSKKPDDYLFQGRNGKVNPRTVQKVLEKLTHQTGIYISITKLRRSIAMHLIQIGWEEKSVTELLGHSSIRSTRKLLGSSREFYKKLKLPLDKLMDKADRKIY